MKQIYFKRPFLVLSGDHVSVDTSSPKRAEFDITKASMIMGYERLGPKQYRLIGASWKTIPIWGFLKIRSLLGV